jgi:hypothetical protein
MYVRICGIFTVRIPSGNGDYWPVPVLAILVAMFREHGARNGKYLLEPGPLVNNY